MVLHHCTSTKGDKKKRRDDRLFQMTLFNAIYSTAKMNG